MPVRPAFRTDRGEIIPLLADDTSSSTSVDISASTNAADSLSNSQSDSKTSLEFILHGNVGSFPQANLEAVGLPPPPIPEKSQGFHHHHHHHTVSLPLPLGAVLVLRNAVRQVLNAVTGISVGCLVLYQSMLTQQMRTRIVLQSALWAVVPATRNCLHSGYLPLVFLPSIAMAWLWNETYLGRASLAHGAIGEPTPDTCPHGNTACRALFGMVVTTAMSAMCFAAEIGLFWYSEHGPYGNVWLQDGEKRLIANFLRGHRHEELRQRPCNAESHALQDRFTPDQCVTEVMHSVPVAQISVHVQLVDNDYTQVAPIPLVSARHHIDSSSDEETVAYDESLQSSETDDDSDENNDKSKPYDVNIGSSAAHIGYDATRMSALAVDFLTLSSEMGSKVEVIPVQQHSFDNKAEVAESPPDILSPVPRCLRVSPLLYSQLSLTGAAYMPVRSAPHLMVQPPVAASFYREAQFEKMPLSNVSSPPAPMPLNAAVPGDVYSFDDPIRSIRSVVLFKNYAAVDQECIRRRLGWAQAMVDKENAAAQSLLAMATTPTDDDEEDEGDDDESENSEEAGKDPEDERPPPGLAGTLTQEVDKDQDDWDTHALVAQAHTVHELRDEDARFLESLGFYSTYDEGECMMESEGQVLSWLCGDQFSPQDS